jgi:ATP-dependent Clp protease ATP-binding subunit ClpA
VNLAEPSLDELVARVKAAVARGELGQLDAALTLAEVLNGRADELTTHFVELARQAGHSWTVIGQRFGVTKQAARERFGDRPADLSAAADLTPTLRLRACLAAAESEAGEGPVRTEHQLIGLFQDGVGASILERLGMTQENVRTEATSLRAELGGTDTLLTDEVASRRIIERACQLARRAGHDYLGTEHVLAALILDPGSRARRVLQRLGFDFATAKRDLDQCLKPRRKPRRRGRRQGTMACDFCGKQRRDGVRLVAGPGVCICEDCVRLAQDVIPEQPIG